MKLSTSIIRHELSQMYPLVPQIPDGKEGATYDFPILYQDGIECSGHVLVGGPEILEAVQKDSKNLENTLLVCVAPKKTDISKQKSTAVLKIHKRSASVIEVFNFLQQIFSRFASWDESLQYAAMTANSFQSMIDCCETITPLSLTVLDKYNKLIAYSKKYEHDIVIPNRVGDDMSLPWKFINDSALRKEYKILNQRKDIFSFSFAEINYEVLGKNLFHHGEFVGGVGMVIDQQSDLAYCKALLEHLHYYAEKLYDRIFFSKPTVKLTEFFYLITRKLDGEDIEEGLWDASYSALEWERQNTLQLVEFRISPYYNDDSDEELYVDNLIAQLHQDWFGVYAFQYRRHLYTIVNHSIFSSDNGNDFYRVLPYFLRDNLLIAGISKTFTDINQLPDMLLQAESALEIGMIKNPTQWYHRFDAYVLSFINKNSPGKMSREAVCSDKLLKLKSYDTRKGTEYYKTLYTYLQCLFNSSETAKKLFIQRSTFLYRMDRIKKIADIQLDSYEEICHLILSFSILEEDSNLF